MPVYEYTALDKEGRQISGLIDAESPAAARQKIRGQDQYPIGLTGADQAAFSLKRLMRSGPAFRQKRQIPLFTRQLATLLSTDIPPNASFQILPFRHQPEQRLSLLLFLRFFRKYRLSL